MRFGRPILNVNAKLEYEDCEGYEDEDEDDEKGPADRWVFEPGLDSIRNLRHC